MSGTLAGCDSWFGNPAAQAGTHFGVGRGGEVHQYFDLDQGPFGHGAVEAGCAARLVHENGPALNPNWYLAGIEHDDLGRGALPTEEQFEASARLAAAIFRDAILPHAARTGAVIDRDHILRHTEISPRSRPHCPGWPEELLGRYVERVQTLAGEGPESVAPSRAEPEPARPTVTDGAAYTVRAGDTLSAIAARFGLRLNELRDANPAVHNPHLLHTGQRLIIPSARAYTVQRGDTFARIALAHGVAVERLRAANPAVENPNMIRVGEQLLVPAAPGEGPERPAGPGEELPDVPDARLGFAALWPSIAECAARYETDARVLAGIICQESDFVNWRVHRDGTGHGLIGLDDNGLLPDFERWSGRAFGRGEGCASIPAALQVEYLARIIAASARQHGGDALAAARQWHRGPRLMDDERGWHYQALIQGHIARLFD
jgi:LysM repeat protein